LFSALSSDEYWRSGRSMNARSLPSAVFRRSSALLRISRALRVGTVSSSLAYHDHPGLGGQVNKKLSLWQYRACRAPESNWRDQAARSLFPPIERTSLQLPTKTGHFKAVFQCFSRVRSTESSEFMERAMGIEPTSEVWEALECTSLIAPPTIQISQAGVR
jgi:hypothetical protein